MDVRQLHYVLAVVDHGGFTPAARAMRVSQPSLSHGIRRLESELGVTLFARVGRGVTLTSAGAAVAERARRVVNEMADLAAVSAALTGLRRGHLDLAALATLAVDPLARLIGEFRSRYPGVTVRVIEPDDVAGLETCLRDGTAELGFTDLTVGGAGLHRIELFRQPLLAVCPPGTAIDDGPMSAATFAALPQIATPPGTSTRRLLDRTIARSGAAANVVVEVGHREAIEPLVLAGAGATILPEPLARRAGAHGAVVRPLRPAVTRRVGIVHRVDDLSPAAAALVALATAPDVSAPGRVAARRGARPGTPSRTAPRSG